MRCFIFLIYYLHTPTYQKALLCPYPSKLIWGESRYLAAVQSYLEHLRGGSDALRDTAISSFWPPNKLKVMYKYDFEYVDHIRSLEIPSLATTDEPVLLLHDFGTFSSIAVLNQRIARIYQSDKNSLVLSPLVYVLYLDLLTLELASSSMRRRQARHDCCWKDCNNIGGFTSLRQLISLRSGRETLRQH